MICIKWREKGETRRSVQGFLDKLAQYCRETYNPPQLIDVDEQVYNYKGCHPARCFNPNKPAKWHFENFAMNCAATGFMLNFFMYVGKDMLRLGEAFGQYTASEYPPMRLADHHQYRNKNHIMSTDNWYTSIKLALSLKALGIYLIGTIKGNREGLPKDKVLAKKALPPRGYMHSMTGFFPDPTGVSQELFMVAWVDNKAVHMLSTIPIFN
jgi:hypothetical protein